MKTNFRKLQLFFAISKINPEMFYNMEVTSYRIALQGKYTYELAKAFRSWKVSITDAGLIRFEKSIFTVTLTNL